MSRYYGQLPCSVLHVSESGTAFDPRQKTMNAEQIKYDGQRRQWLDDLTGKSLQEMVRLAAV